MDGIEIQEKIMRLPDDMRTEVMGFIEFLLKKRNVKGTGGTRFTFDWEGGLADLKGRFTSVELQHKASEWR